ncbi:MAG: ABC transporter permease [Candidatus Cloacimonetes bacterium]|nr:ABC transporter permease [Candidatus Cloacimonadota bacterium]
MKKAQSIIYPLVFAFAVLCLWTFLSQSSQSLKWIIPSPMAVIAVFFTHPQMLFSHFTVTMLETLAGLLLSIVFGSLIAIAMDKWKAFQKTVYPFVIVSQTVPIIALAPLFILWFGYGITAKIFIVTLVCFFPIAVNLYDGFRQVSPDYLRLFQSMNARPLQVFFLLKIPSALPSFFTGLKLAVSYSVMSAIIGEWLGGIKGLGIYMTRATRSYQTAHVFAIIVLISLFSLLLYGIVILVERIILKWHFVRLEEYIDTQ